MTQQIVKMSGRGTPVTAGQIDPPHQDSGDDDNAFASAQNEDEVRRLEEERQQRLREEEERLAYLLQRAEARAREEREAIRKQEAQVARTRAQGGGSRSEDGGFALDTTDLISTDETAILHMLAIFTVVVSKESFEGLKSEWEYQGFDPVVIHKKMVQKFRPGGDNTMAKFQDDIAMLMIFYCIRGTKISKAIKRMKSGGVERISALKDKYDVKDKRPDDRETITLGRVAATYPIVVVQLMAHHKIMGIVDEQLLVTESFVYPHALRTPVAISLIPKGAKNMRRAAFKYNILFTKVINKGKADLEAQKQYFLAAMNSQVYSNSVRGQLWVQLRIFDNADDDLETDTWLTSADQDPLE